MKALRIAAEASKAIRAVRAADEDRLVAERIAHGGRPAPKPGDLSNNLPEGKRPVPGVYEYMGLFEDDGA
jgi:hypothetical protein